MTVDRVMVLLAAIAILGCGDNSMGESAATTSGGASSSSSDDPSLPQASTVAFCDVVIMPSEFLSMDASPVYPEEQASRATPRAPPRGGTPV